MYSCTAIEIAHHASDITKEIVSVKTITYCQEEIHGRNIISVTKPYVIVKSVILDPIVRFPDSAVKSVKYRGSKINQDAFAVATDEAA